MKIDKIQLCDATTGTMDNQAPSASFVEANEQNFDTCKSKKLECDEIHGAKDFYVNGV